MKTFSAICKPTGYCLVLAALLGQLAYAQNFSVPTEQQPPKSAVENLLNPFGDSWHLRKSNPDIPIVTSFGCYRKLPAAHRRPVPEQLNFSRALSPNFMFGECSPVMDEPEKAPKDRLPSVLKEVIATLKAFDPKIKYLGYMALSEFSSDIPGSSEIATEHGEWLLKQNGTELARNRKGARVLDVRNLRYQDFVAARIRHSLDVYQMDGFLADGIKERLRDWSPNANISAEADAQWGNGWIKLLKKVKGEIGSKLIFVNVQRKDLAFIEKLLDVVDGVMLEDPFGPVRADLERSGRRAQFEEVFKLAADKNKFVVNVINTNINGTTFETTTADQERQFARYYLAAYLVFRQSANNVLQYYTPSKLGPQFASQPFFLDWNVRLGEATEHYFIVAPGVYRRNYERATVYLNNSSNMVYVAEGAVCRSSGNEPRCRSAVSVGPKSGLLTFR